MKFFLKDNWIILMLAAALVFILMVVFFSAPGQEPDKWANSNESTVVSQEEGTSTLLSDFRGSDLHDKIAEPFKKLIFLIFFILIGSLLYFGYNFITDSKSRY